MINIGRARNLGKIMVSLRDFTFHSVLFYNVCISLLCVNYFYVGGVIQLVEQWAVYFLMYIFQYF